MSMVIFKDNFYWDLAQLQKNQGLCYGYPDFYQPPSPSPLSEEEFVALCVEHFGGSWQGLFHKLTKAGYGLYKTSVS